MDQSVCFLFMTIIVLAAFVFAMISTSHRHKHGGRLDVEKYRLKYLEIENRLKINETSTYHLTVLEADKLVDQALKDRGFSGDTMGERLKSANDVFTSRNGIWAAHKLRNVIAHESDAKVSYKEARGALACFKKALKDLGAI